MAQAKRSYRRLDADQVILTIDRLRDRVGERFADAGLTEAAAELGRMARDTVKRAGAARPYYFLRLLVLLLALVVMGGAAAIGLQIDWRSVTDGSDLLGLTQGLESLVNLVILMGAGIWFLLTLEERWRRARVQRWLHELRAFAHVVDMHQLTKDPTVVLKAGPSTPSSPQRAMTEFQLARYLEYCAEMLALTGKLSALYAGQSNDHVIIAAAGDVENLCTDLGRKVWQKIMILSQLDEGRA
ncbi:hypothetical protein QO010_002434 [Caulobacter ginsengisoli]|uniref:SMODS and SLOG-associating 2TM effector domain-containing protein n=1 Tax=Caulobacter ginsengisoli TaxID=400775 RepID=A0ABU0IRK9_9CAUL|nr:hypothetical protein [Caulobacter ginsengisoli]MDQ0464650.1 hypothetical protein [Caulobacter ginsengisoli]